MCIGKRLRGFVSSARIADDADAERVNCVIGHGRNQSGEDGAWAGEHLHEVSSSP